MISFYNSVFLAFDRIHIFCCDQNSMSVCGRKIYDDNCDLFLASRDFKCKERNWEFTKVHEGGPRPGHLHFTLFNRFKTVLFTMSQYSTPPFHLNKEESCAQYLMMIIMIMILIIRLTNNHDDNDHEHGLCTEPVYILLDSSWPNICIPWK